MQDGREPERGSEEDLRDMMESALKLRRDLDALIERIAVEQTSRAIIKTIPEHDIQAGSR